MSEHRRRQALMQVGPSAPFMHLLLSCADGRHVHTQRCKFSSLLYLTSGALALFFGRRACRSCGGCIGACSSRALVLGGE